MEISKDKQPQTSQPTTNVALPADELKRLTDFFSILIEIDKRLKKKASKSL